MSATLQYTVVKVVLIQSLVTMSATVQTLLNLVFGRYVAALFWMEPKPPKGAAPPGFRSQSVLGGSGSRNFLPSQIPRLPRLHNPAGNNVSYSSTHTLITQWAAQEDGEVMLEWRSSLHFD